MRCIEPIEIMIFKMSITASEIIGKEIGISGQTLINFNNWK